MRYNRKFVWIFCLNKLLIKEFNSIDHDDVFALYYVEDNIRL